jgi:hypothetical protein
MTVQYLSDLTGTQIGVQVLFSMEEWASNKEKIISQENENAILDSIRAGLKDVKLHQEGKKTLKTLQEVIDEF